MGLLSKLLGGSDEPETDEEEETGPQPDDKLTVRFNLSSDHVHKKVEVTYDDGTTETLYYDKYEEEDGKRVYMKIVDAEGAKTYNSWRGDYDEYGIDYEYEQVKEIVVQNVRSFGIQEEYTYTYYGEHETTMKREDYERYDRHYDDVEVIEDPAEGDE